MTTTDSIVAPSLPARRKRMREEYGTALIVVALAVGVLLGLWVGTLIANSQRDGCTHLGAVWVATASGTRCVPVGSFTSFLLNMTR